MKSSSIMLLCVILALAAACSGGGGGSSGSSAPAAPSIPAITLPNGLTLLQVTGNNVLTLTIDGSECSAATVAQWPNKPCVSVTICDPNNPGNCQTVNDILLDTGDYGVRIFQQALTQPGLLTALSQNPVQAGLYECVEYGDGSTVWGPVEWANVVLAGEQAVKVPIQVDRVYHARCGKWIAARMRRRVFQPDHCPVQRKPGARLLPPGLRPGVRKQQE